jgi:hypothetical protein
VAEVYRETFDNGAGGWVADLSSRLPVWDGVAYCHSPWSIDANHAPPGAGYLHLLNTQHVKSFMTSPVASHPALRRRSYFQLHFWSRPEVTRLSRADSVRSRSHGTAVPGGSTHKVPSPAPVHPGRVPARARACGAPKVPPPPIFRRNRSTRCHRTTAARAFTFVPSVATPSPCMNH